MIETTSSMSIRSLLVPSLFMSANGLNRRPPFVEPYEAVARTTSRISTFPSLFMSATFLLEIRLTPSRMEWGIATEELLVSVVMPSLRSELPVAVLLKTMVANVPFPSLSCVDSVNVALRVIRP